MLCVLLVFIAVLSSIVFLNEKYKYCHPVFINGFIRCIVIILTSLGLYDIYKISNNIYFIFIIGIVFFAIGSLIKIPKFKIRQLKRTEEFNDELYKYLLIIGIIFQLIIVYRAIQLLIDGGSYSDIRMSFGEVGLGTLNNAIESLFWGYYIKPMLYVTLTQLAVHVYYNHLSKKTLSLTIFYVLLNQIDISRIVVFYMLIMLYVGWYMKMKKNSKKINIENIIKVLIIICLVFIIFDWMSSLRDVNDTLFKSIYEYFVTGLVQLDIRIQEFSLHGLNHTYGVSFLAGILSPFFLILENVFSFVPSIWINYIEASEYINEFIKISNTTLSNAFVTDYYYFFLDFSYLGIAIESFLFGIVSTYLFKKNKQNSTNYNLSMYMIIVVGIFTSFIRWQFSQPAYVFSFIYIYIIYRKKERKYYDRRESK